MADRTMFQVFLRRCAIMVPGLLCGGCYGVPQQAANHYYPPVPPVWIVEDDPKVTIYDRKDLERDRKVGKMLVIPLYMGYRHQSETDFLAIAHPFVYEQGEDIEKQLRSFPQRENLRRLVFWVRGYFPDGMGRTFRWVPTINGTKMVVVELQRCIESEQRQIDAAMKTLLEGDFLIGEAIKPKPPPPPYTGEPRATSEPYDASRLVRSVEYQGRFFNHQFAENGHVLWGFNPGTRIVNRLSADEKNTVATFAAEILEISAERPSTDCVAPGK